jgi:hypothetical protein
MNSTPFVGGIEARAFGHGPAFEGGIELKPEVIMQT